MIHIIAGCAETLIIRGERRTSTGINSRIPAINMTWEWMILDYKFQETHVATLVREYPRTADVFRSAGIDYCCGGRIPLSEAAGNCRFDPEEVYIAVQQKIEASGHRDGIDMRYMSVPGMIDYIQNKYHQDLNEELVNLTPFVARLAARHGAAQPHLTELRGLFEKFKGEMTGHTADEDDVVFPLIASYANGDKDVTVQEVEYAVHKLVNDHEGTGALLMRMREITEGYELPAAACGTYTLVYSRLEDMEKRTFDHVHMENHILFEKVSDMIKRSEA